MGKLGELYGKGMKLAGKVGSGRRENRDKRVAIVRQSGWELDRKARAKWDKSREVTLEVDVKWLDFCCKLEEIGQKKEGESRREWRWSWREMGGKVEHLSKEKWCA